MPLKTFAGGALFGSSYGRADPEILALHGWGRTHRDFDTVLAGLDAVALDLPGFGSSPEPPEVWGAEAYAEAVVEVARSFARPPVVVGHSFGGRVAVSLAAKHPSEVRSLVLIGVPLVRAPGRAPARSPRGYRLVKWAHRMGIVSESRLEAARQRHGSADYRAADGRMRDILVKVVNESYENQLDQLAVPVHLLWGSEDTAAPPAIAQEALRRMEAHGVAVDLELLEGVGHHVMAEAPDRVRARLVSALERDA